MKKYIVLFFVVFALAAMSVVSVSADSITDEFCDMVEMAGYIDSSLTCSTTYDGACRCRSSQWAFGVATPNDAAMLESWWMANEFAKEIGYPISCSVESYEMIVNQDVVKEFELVCR